MSEADVSLIRDEDVLRRMWQQTEDFSRKKQIRAHMYRLREERLRSLYSPEPSADKGVSFISRGAALADQSFQSLKHKEVRDAASPPHDRDLKELSNAGWNVESENKTTDNGRTHERSLQANIEGRYEVEGGQGQFAAREQQRHAQTEYTDDDTRIKRQQQVHSTAATEHEVRNTSDGSNISTATSTSSSSRFRETSTRHETAPCLTEEHYDLHTNRADETNSRYDSAELVSRKVEYPDESTRIVVETRRLPDGTRVTSTRREFRAPQHTSRAQVQAHRTRSEINSSFSTQQRSELKQSSLTTREDKHTADIVDAQRNIDEHDFKKHDYTTLQKDEYLQKQNVDEKKYESRRVVDETDRRNIETRDTEYVQQNDTTEINRKDSDQVIKKKISIEQRDNLETQRTTKTDESIDKVTKKNVENIVDRKVMSDQYETTYQSDFTNKRVSNDWSPTQQAWASTLRGDSPPQRRSSASPDKSRSTSPNKYERPSSTTHSVHSSTEINTRYSIADRKPDQHRPSASPDRKPNRLDVDHTRPSQSPDRKPTYKSDRSATRPDISPTRHQPDSRKTTDEYVTTSLTRPSTSPDRKPGYMRPTASRNTQESSNSPLKHAPSQSPERKTKSKIQEDHYKFIDEETKLYTRSDKTDVKYKQSSSPARDMPDNARSDSPTSLPRPSLRKHSRSPSPPKGPVTFTQDHTFYNKKYDQTKKVDKFESTVTDFSSIRNRNSIEIPEDSSPKRSPQRESPPSKFGTYDKKQRYSEEKEDISINKTTEDIHKYDTLRRQDKTQKIQTLISPTGKSPSDGSPLKSPTKDSKYKHTTDFISIEKRSEEVNKKSKDHVRQLVTPSASPTRKPKTDEAEPSTGHSSPTTSVSGFVYFQSPRPDTVMVTDLDDQEYYFETNTTEDTTTVQRRPETLNLKRSPSPTKIPCRSPSLEKRSPKDSLPRKSSLKKPSITDSQVSPIEKPPSSFHVSPNVETKEFSEHKIVKKDRPDKTDPDSSVKVKPPFERRETYEERCRKILGMVRDENTKSQPESNTSSPSVSPCYSPVQTDDSLAVEHHDEEIVNKTSEFISEKQDNTTRSRVTDRIAKSSSRETSPTKLKDTIAHSKPVTKTSGFISEIKHTRRSPSKSPEIDLPIRETQDRKSESPDRKPGYMRPTTTSIKHEVTSHSDSIKTEVNTHSSLRSSVSPPPTRKKSVEPKDFKPKHPKETEPKHSRTPSPVKTIKTTEINKEFIASEREQQILDKVQQSLRKLSPTRTNKSPSREKSPSKTATSLQDLDIKATELTESEVVVETTKQTSIKKEIISSSKQKDVKPEQKSPTKPQSHNSSPTKKPNLASPKPDRSQPSPIMSRSISPKKNYTPERPQSPGPRASGIKPREQIPSHLTRKPTPATLSPTKIDKTITESKKSTLSKQNSFTKTTTSKTTSNKINQSPTSKPNDTDQKRTPLLVKGINKENVSPKKESDVKLTQTASDISIKSKKTSPQRVRSKPEIQVCDVSSKATKQTSTLKTQKTIKEPQTNLSSKPKSATALNTATEDDDIIIDIQQAKSSRENSPDRICPTPISFMEDVGTPRYPDEVCEPDDEFRKRTHHTIHETESIVDDIVEISEEDELFAKRTHVDRVTGSDECLLSVTDKVSKFTNKIETVAKPKESTAVFKDTEIKSHSDFIDEKLKSDECLLSVTEKVNKFAKGPRETKDSQSQSRKIVDEYDINTEYQDNYSKLNVNDKAHLFIETAENIKSYKAKPTQKMERPDLSNIDESLKSDDCLLSVSDKVTKFVKTAEQFLNETHTSEEKEKKIKEQHDIIMKKILQGTYDEAIELEEDTIPRESKVKPKVSEHVEDKLGSFAKETASSHAKNKDYASPNLKPTAERTPVVKLTTLRSSEAVKKAKALFENIATSQNAKDTHTTKTTKLMDIGVIKKSPKTDSTIVLHPSLEGFPKSDAESEVEVPMSKDRPSSTTLTRTYQAKSEDKSRLSTQTSDMSQVKSPARHEPVTKSVLSRYPVAPRAESPRRVSHDKLDKKPTSTLLKEKTEDVEVSSRRGSGKFGVELRRTSAESATLSSERRRSSDHHQPCIEDIYDLDLLEQMLEKVVGYEQRRRIRSQIRVAKKRMESEHVINTNTYTRTNKHTVTTETKNRSPERQYRITSTERVPTINTSSPERRVAPQKNLSPDRKQEREPAKPYMNGHAKEPVKTVSDKRQRPHSLEKPAKTRSPVRHPSPEKKTRTLSPSKAASNKPKPNRFNEYASAYMKKVGLTDNERLNFAETKTKKTTNDEDCKLTKQVEERKSLESKLSSSSITKSSERTLSKDRIEVKMNGKRSPSPEKKRERSPTTRLEQRTPTPDFKRRNGDRETIIQTVLEKIPSKQEDKPSWITNRNLKKMSSETRSFSSKKIESEKQKYRAPSPSKIISKPTDVITSSYGPGPLDADGKPLFGIKALRNGSTKVKGTVIRQEFHSRNGSAPEGSVSVTAYSSSPAELEELLRSQGGAPPSRLHGLAAITTTKKFGGDTGTTYREVHTKEERAALDQFTHSDRRVDSQIENMTENIRRKVDTKNTREADREERRSTMDKSREEKHKRIEEKKEMREDRKTVRQSSVKSLTEKYIKSASDTTKSERSSYPKAGLILRTTTMRESVSSDSSHAGLVRTDSEHSLASVEDSQTLTRSQTESTHSQTESSRSHTESSRSQTESTRSHTESSRSQTESTRSQNQSARSQKQSARSHTESARSQTQSSRTQTETNRVNGETAGNRTRNMERSFLDSSTKVTGVQDILSRMKNADIVIEAGDSSEDAESRALLNKFLGATVLMSGMSSYVQDAPAATLRIRQEFTGSSTVGGQTTSSVKDIDQCWDERLLRKLLEESSDYDLRRRLRARIRTLMAEQEACASAVTEALEAAPRDEAGEAARGEAGEASEAREETVVKTSERRNSSEKTVSSSTTTKTSKVIESMSRPAPKPVSPFTKFRQLEKQNSTTNPNSPASPQSPGSQPLFKFTDPALQCSALTIKERLLQWCRDKTKHYENVKLENFSTSWADGLAFCALLHHFLPDAFDYQQLTPDKRRHNFTLAFKVADEKAGIYPLLDVDDMVAMRKPDWKCVFTYVQSIHRRFKDQV